MPSALFALLSLPNEWSRLFSPGRTDLRFVRKSLRNCAATALQALTQRACVKNASFFSRPLRLHSRPFLLALCLPPFLSLSSPFSLFSDAQVSARAHGAFYAGDPAAVLCNFLFDFSRRPGQEGSNRFTILTNEFLEVARGGGRGPFPHFARLIVCAFVSFLNSFFPSSFLCPAEPLFTLRITRPRCRLALSPAIILTRRSRPFPRDPLRLLPTRTCQYFRRVR